MPAVAEEDFVHSCYFLRIRQMMKSLPPVEEKESIV
jgi:hypothetical protein